MAAAFSLADLPPWAFDKEDPGDDRDFYAEARLVTHIDDGAIAALTGFYRAAAAAGRGGLRPDEQLGQPPARRHRPTAR